MTPHDAPAGRFHVTLWEEPCRRCATHSWAVAHLGTAVEGADWGPLIPVDHMYFDILRCVVSKLLYVIIDVNINSTSKDPNWRAAWRYLETTHFQYMFSNCRYQAEAVGCCWHRLLPHHGWTRLALSASRSTWRPARWGPPTSRAARAARAAERIGGVPKMGVPPVIIHEISLNGIIEHPFQ